LLLVRLRAERGSARKNRRALRRLSDDDGPHFVDNEVTMAVDLVTTTADLTTPTEGPTMMAMTKGGGLCDDNERRRRWKQDKYDMV
jgi:hypothetical protein